MPPEDIPVRDAIDADRPALQRILEASPEAGDWRDLDWSPPRRCLVAVVRGEPAGLLLASCPADDEAEILTLAVDPARRGRGVAQALLTAFLAGRRGRVSLEVRPSNTPARRLYERFGFGPAGLRRGYYHSPAEDALVLQLLFP